MMRFFRAGLVLSFLLVGSSFSGPKIKFDSTTINCGLALEGKTDKLNANFVVRNMGDAVLKLQSVRPGCGCTVVKYDSIIAPGKSATIESHVNIAGYHSGPISKFITVTSNDENQRSIRLTITATIQAVIDMADTYISLDQSNASTPRTYILSCKKKDLAISSVKFSSNDNTAKPGWQAKLSIPLKFTFTPTDSLREDGYRVFKLNLYYSPVDNSQSGQFVIKTNHPDKEEITIQGSLNK